MTLRDDIIKWDGRSAADIEMVFASNSIHTDFLDELIELLADVECQIGASWLLKRYLELGRSINDNQIKSVFENMIPNCQWPCQLYFLQSLPFMKIPVEFSRSMASYIENCLSSDNKFVRAWAYNGLYELANIFPTYRQGLDVVFDAAMETEPASVRARIKAVRKKISKNWPNGD